MMAGIAWLGNTRPQDRNVLQIADNDLPARRQSAPGGVRLTLQNWIWLGVEFRKKSARLARNQSASEWGGSSMREMALPHGLGKDSLFERLFWRPFIRKQHLVTDRAAIERLSARNQAGSGAELFASARDIRWHNEDMEFGKDFVEAVWGG
jgi:hypothetical protein